MKPEALARWEKTRAKGMLNYILVRGILSYGLAMFVAMTFVVHHEDLSPKFIGISAIAWTIGGALFGISTWYVLERQFRKATENNVA